MARFTGGWVKWYRKIGEDELFDDVATSAIWDHLVLWAAPKNHDAGRKRLRSGKVAMIKRGQVLTSAVRLGERFKFCGKPIGRNVAERVLRELEAAGAISMARSSDGTIITLLKFGHYQDKTKLRQQLPQQQSSSRPAAKQQQTSNAPARIGELPSGEEEEKLRTPSAPTRPPVDPKSARLSATALAKKAEGAVRKNLSEDDARDHLGPTGWAVIEACYAGWEDFKRAFRQAYEKAPSPTYVTAQFRDAFEAEIHAKGAQ